MYVLGARRHVRSGLHLSRCGMRSVVLGQPQAQVAAVGRAQPQACVAAVPQVRSKKSSQGSSTVPRLRGLFPVNILSHRHLDSRSALPSELVFAALFTFRTPQLLLGRLAIAIAARPVFVGRCLRCGR